MRRFPLGVGPRPVGAPTRFAAAAGLFLSTLPALGQERTVPVSLELERGPGTETCISEARLRRRVEERLGRELSSASDATLHISGTLSREDAAAGSGAFRARLVIRDESAVIGERELSDARKTCAGLTETLVLAVTLMIDPEAALAEPTREEDSASSAAGADSAAPPAADDAPSEPAVEDSEPTPPAVEPAPAAGPGPKPSPSQPDPDKRERAPRKVRVKPDSESRTESGTWAIEIAGAGRAALLPDLSFGGGAGIVLLPASWGIGLRGSLWLPALAEEGPLRVNLSYFEAALGVCPRLWSADGGRFALCARVHFGSLAASGEGLDEPADDRALIGQVSAGGEFSARVARLGARSSMWGFVGSSGLVPFLRPQIIYLEEQTEAVLYRAPAFGGELEVGFRFEFP